MSNKTYKRYERLENLSKDTGFKVYYPLSKYTKTISIAKNDDWFDYSTFRKAESALRRIKRNIIL